MKQHVLFSFPRRLGVPGIGHTAWCQVSQLVRQGFAVHLVCGSLERPVKGLASLRQTMKLRLAGGLIGHVKLSYRLLGPRALQRHDQIAAGVLRQISRRHAVVVHAWPGGALHTMQVARDLGAASLLERPNAHTAYAFEAVASEYDRLGMSSPAGHSHTADPVRLEQEEAEFAAADRIACPSPFVRKTFLDRGFTPERLALTSYGYDPERLPKHREPRGESMRFAFIGSAEPRKGLHFALRAWRAIEDKRGATFTIVGGMLPGYEQALGDLLTQPGVKYLGHQNDVAVVLGRTDFLVLPSIEEGSAIVTYEARAAGCGLVVSEAAGARCDHEVHGLVHPVGDVDALTAHLRMLINQPDTADALIAESTRTGHRWNWFNAGTELAAVLRSMSTELTEVFA
ncbi:MAG: glycosyltransferase family 4 protein [Planctomycetota bacterium]